MARRLAFRAAVAAPRRPLRSASATAERTVPAVARASGTAAGYVMPVEESEMRAPTVAIALLLGACAAATKPPAGVGPASMSVPVRVATGAQAARAEAASVAAGFQKELGAALQAAMATGGPVAAIEVCGEAAPAIAAWASHDSGWAIRRVGTRVRNPASGRPDPWEAAQLADFERRLAAGERPEAVESFAIVDAGGVPTERYMKAIVTAPPCLACHGDPAAQSADLRAKLVEHYPDDRATGYRAGELRGAFTLRRPLAGR
jgi:hypothetical protein